MLMLLLQGLSNSKWRKKRKWDWGGGKEEGYTDSKWWRRGGEGRGEWLTCVFNHSEADIWSIFEWACLLAPVEKVGVVDDATTKLTVVHDVRVIGEVVVSVRPNKPVAQTGLSCSFTVHTLVSRGSEAHHSNSDGGRLGERLGRRCHTWPAGGIYTSDELTRCLPSDNS